MLLPYTTIEGKILNEIEMCEERMWLQQNHSSLRVLDWNYQPNRTSKVSYSKTKASKK